MRDPKGKTVADMFPQLFEDDDDDEDEILTPDEIKQLQEEMEAWNASRQQEPTE